MSKNKQVNIEWNGMEYSNAKYIMMMLDVNISLVLCLCVCVYPNVSKHRWS